MGPKEKTMDKGKGRAIDNDTTEGSSNVQAKDKTSDQSNIKQSCLRCPAEEAAMNKRDPKLAGLSFRQSVLKVDTEHYPVTHLWPGFEKSTKAKLEFDTNDKQAAIAYLEHIQSQVSSGKDKAAMATTRNLENAAQIAFPAAKKNVNKKGKKQEAKRQEAKQQDAQQ